MRDLNLLEEIERNPDTTQADLATRIGVAVGTVNWHLKRLIAKGYIKVKRAERRKLRYIIPPEGLSLRAKLTVAYVEQSMALYRDTRDQAKELIAELQDQGYQRVRVEGKGDIVDVCRLTCIEQGIDIVENPNGQVPVIKVKGRELELNLPMEGTETDGEEPRTS